MDHGLDRREADSEYKGEAHNSVQREDVDGGAGGVNGAGYSDEDAPVKWSKKSGDGVGARRTRGAMAGAIGGGSAMDGGATPRGPNYVPGGASPVAFMSPGRPSIVPASPSRRSARSLG